MGIEDTNLLMDRKGSDDSDVKLQTTVRRIDAVFHSCQSFFEVCQPESGEDVYSLATCHLLRVLLWTSLEHFGSFGSMSHKQP
jgi:hypothetical protein